MTGKARKAWHGVDGMVIANLLIGFYISRIAVRYHRILFRFIPLP